MSETTLFEWLRLILLYVVSPIIISLGFPRFPDGIIYGSNIRKIASRDLTYIGRYDKRLTVSVKYWIYSIEVAAYKKDKSADVIDIIRGWNKNCNHDVDSYIYDGIEDAHTMFLCELDKAREEYREPDFKVSEDYDYHVVPSSFLYNDYINPKQLIKSIDMILGGI